MYFQVSNEIFSLSIRSQILRYNFMRKATLLYIIVINSRSMTFNWNPVYCTLACLQFAVQFNKYKDEYVQCVSIKMFAPYSSCSNTFALLQNLDYFAIIFLNTFYCQQIVFICSYLVSVCKYESICYSKVVWQLSITQYRISLSVIRWSCTVCFDSVITAKKKYVMPNII